MLPPPAFLLLSRLSGLAATEPTLSFQHFSFFSPVSPPFPARHLQLFCVFLRFLDSLPPPPGPLLVPVPVILVPVPISAAVLASIPVPVHVPVFVYGSPPPSRSPFPPRPRSRPRSRPALFCSSPPLFPFPLCPRPHDRSRPRYRLRSHPRLKSRPRRRLLLPVPRTRLPPRYDALVQTPGLANGAVGCSQAPPPVCRDGDVCRMRVPAVKQRESPRMTCYFCPFRQMLGLIGVCLRPVLYPPSRIGRWVCRRASGPW